MSSHATTRVDGQQGTCSTCGPVRLRINGSCPTVHTRRKWEARSGVRITQDEFDQLRLREVCDACGQPEPQNGYLAVDHDHLTGAVRGALCTPCNRALGMAQEDPARLRALAEYVERHR